MRKTDRERYRIILQERLDELVDGRLQVVRAQRAATREPPGDDADDAQRVLVADTEIAMTERELQVAQQIEAAIERLDQGRFGRCVDCGALIERERLEAVPWALRCTADQEAFEQSRGEQVPTL
jgi:DnaK suppressor protein